MSEKTKYKDSREKDWSLKILNYEVTVDKDQYILNGYTKAGRKKDGSDNKWKSTTYHRRFSDVFEYIREKEVKASIVDAQTLDEAIERINECNNNFIKLLEPLKKIDN